MATAQEQAPPLLVHAAACLTAKKQLPSSGATALSFGYRIDATSYPGHKTLYVVAAAGSSHTTGKAFSIFYTEKGRHPILDIQNGTSFLRSGNGAGDIHFVEPPFGGEATEGSFAAAIQQIEGQPWFTISAADLNAPLGPIRCESYTDEP